MRIKIKMGDAERIQVLLDVKHTLEDLIATRTEQIEEMKKEIENLNQKLIKLSQQISSQSFTSADSLLEIIQRKESEKMIPSQSSNEKNGSSITKRLFSKNNEVLAHFQYENEVVFIRFPQPKVSGITPEIYINSFVRENLINLKQFEPEISPKITKKQEDGQDFVETITINKVQKYESFESIFDAIKNLMK